MVPKLGRLQFTLVMKDLCCLVDFLLDSVVVMACGVERHLSATLVFYYIDSINISFPTEVCTVELVGDIEVTGDAAIYSFRGVGSGTTSYFCKLDGVLLPDCMCCLPSTLNNEHKLM